jgi:hypothetical protein
MLTTNDANKQFYDTVAPNAYGGSPDVAVQAASSPDVDASFVPPADNDDGDLGFDLDDFMHDFLQHVRVDQPQVVIVNRTRTRSPDEVLYMDLDSAKAKALEGYTDEDYQWINKEY